MSNSRINYLSDLDLVQTVELSALTSNILSVSFHSYFTFILWQLMTLFWLSNQPLQCWQALAAQ